MISEAFLQELEAAYEARDLQKLQSFCSATYREINTSQAYSSVLMLSCNNIKHLSKIPTLEADCIMLNLEDGVSQEEKPFALVLCAIFLSKLPKCEKKLVVRVNALNNGGYDEIAYLNQYMPDAVRVPKIKTPKEVEQVRALLHEKTELHLSIETKEAWHNLKELKKDPMVKAYYLGILDLFADLGLPHSGIRMDNPTMLYILPHFLLTCRSMNIKAVSFVFQEYKDTQTFTKWLELEKSIGFDAKGCISPLQARLVNQILKDGNEKELERAREIVRLFEEKKAEGITGFSDERYGFIDEPVYKGALSLLGKNHASR